MRARLKGILTDRCTAPRANHVPARWPRGGQRTSCQKIPTTLRLDTTALNRLRASGKGRQTRAAAVLAKHALLFSYLVDADVLICKMIQLVHGIVWLIPRNVSDVRCWGELLV
ncbi:BrnA antitoxin family protein [Rhodoferax sp.]|uniref:BrnA antitoxin family protein n=1 Tax=Rhodoferax sp. TaxID=50421 RepID=UPI00344E5518